MASSTPQEGAPLSPPSNLPKYFNDLSAQYAQQTGNSTSLLFSQIIDGIAPITTSSTIHDNACGPGTATAALFTRVPNGELPTVIGTDMVPGMVQAFESMVSKNSWGGWVSATVMKSENLAFPDGTFSHSITNFSIFNFPDPQVCCNEIYRTLKVGGQALVTTWKLFGIGEIIHAAQREIRPDLPLMKFSGPEMYSNTAVVEVLAQAGFNKGRIVVANRSQVIEPGEYLQGLTAFAKGPFTNSARAQWTDEEQGKWPGVVDEVISQEVKRNGGVKFEMWAVFATK